VGIFFGREQRTGQTFAEPPIPPFPGATMFGGTSSAIAATPDKALAVPTVWACVGLLSNAVSMLPLETFQRSGGGVPRRVDDPAVVTSPAATMTQSEWLHMLMVSLLLRGNAYGLLTREMVGGVPTVTGVDLLSPDNVQVTRDRETGRVVYKLGNSQVDRSADIWHVRGLTMPGSRVGLSPISYAAATIGVDIHSRTFASDFFSDGAHPSSIITSDQQINQEQARTIKDRVIAAVRGREPAVLGAGVKWEQIQVSPEESQFLATQQANVAQIARFFWIPPEMVGGDGGNSMTYANVEQRSLDFLTYAVSFWLKRIEDAVFSLLPDPQYVRFNTAALLRTDAATQAQVDNMQLAGKTRVPSELRSRDGLPPFTDDQRVEADMVPLTITPNGGAKALPALKTPPGPEAPVPAADDQQGAIHA
jgi:HK97 family phage portal protein